MENVKLILMLMNTMLVLSILCILIPWKGSYKTIVGVVTVLSLPSTLLITSKGTDFMVNYGYPLIGIPFCLVLYIFSSVKELTFLFVVFTTMIFQQMAWAILGIVKVLSGYSIVYFICSIFLFGGFAYRSFYSKKVFITLY